MAALVFRTKSVCVKYEYRDHEGKRQQVWETYKTKLEASQRKALIDSLQEEQEYTSLAKEAAMYRKQRTAAQAPASQEISAVENDGSMTFDEFFAIWLPKHARKKRLSPNTVDTYMQLWEKHVKPLLGNRSLKEATTADIDEFVDRLSQTKCSAPGGRGRYSETDTLASSSVRKIYNIVSVLLQTAEKWDVIEKAHVGDAPSAKTKKRAAWSAKQVSDVLRDITGAENAILHLAIHMAFICSLRSGEVAGLGIGGFDFAENACRINQTLQRVSDKSLALLPDNEIIKTFPKIKTNSTSTLILKLPKTEGSDRKQYLPEPLVCEVKARLRQIERDKEQYGCDYHDHGLLISWPNGDPIEPHRIEKWFKEWQRSNGVENVIDILRGFANPGKCTRSGFRGSITNWLRRTAAIRRKS